MAKYSSCDSNFTDMKSGSGMVGLVGLLWPLSLDLASNKFSSQLKFINSNAAEISDSISQGREKATTARVKFIWMNGKTSGRQIWRDSQWPGIFWTAYCKIKGPLKLRLQKEKLTSIHTSPQFFPWLLRLFSTVSCLGNNFSQLTFQWVWPQCLE